MDVELYADPSCPWSWAAFQWLDQVAPHRQLRLVQRPFSLVLRDGTDQLPEPKRVARRQAHRALRVAAAIDDDELRWAYFAAVTAPAYCALAAGERPEFDVAAAAAAVGLGDETVGRADDVALDATIADHMATAARRAAAVRLQQQRIPLLVVGAPTGRAALLGPLLDPVPTGQLATRLWDAVETVVSLPGMYEISRPRPSSHSLLAAAAAQPRER